MQNLFMQCLLLSAPRIANIVAMVNTLPRESCQADDPDWQI